MPTNNVKNMNELPLYLRDEDMLNTLDGWGYAFKSLGEDKFALLQDGFTIASFDGLADFLSREINGSDNEAIAIWETRAIYSARQVKKILDENKDGHIYIAEFRENAY